MIAANLRRKFDLGSCAVENEESIYACLAEIYAISQAAAIQPSTPLRYAVWRFFAVLRCLFQRGIMIGLFLVLKQVVANPSMSSLPLYFIRVWASCKQLSPWTVSHRTRIQANLSNCLLCILLFFFLYHKVFLLKKQKVIDRNYFPCYTKIKYCFVQ